MLKDEEKLLARLNAGESFTTTEDLSAGYRAELLRLMAVFVDSELAGAAGFAGMINRAPNLAEKIAATHIVAEKLQHAERVLKLMVPFGVNPKLYVASHAWCARLSRDADLGTRRVGGDKRLNVFHYPLEGWTDAVVFNWLMGSASLVQLGALEQASYQPLAQAITHILTQEKQHAAQGATALRELLTQQPNALSAVQAGLDYWYPRVVATFGRGDSAHINQMRQYRLRTEHNTALLEAWQAALLPAVHALGLVVR